MIDRRTLIGTGAAACLLPAAASADIALPEDLSTNDLTTVTSVKTTSRRIAITFDDGPHPRLTPPLLDLLRARGIRATFYLIGNRVAQYPKLAARIANEGHEIGNHSWSHPFLNKHSDSSVLSQIDRTNLEIYRATGRAPVTFRPPYGAFTRRQRKMLHDTRNLPSVLWSVDPQDWRRPGAQVVARRILSGARPGAIVLSHDIHPGTVRAMPQVLDQLGAQGYSFATVSGILGWPDWSHRTFRLADAGRTTG